MTGTSAVPRFWGTPLPIWRDENRGEKCIGSVEELYNEIEKSVAAGIMEKNPLKEAGFVVGDFSQENYDKIDLHPSIRLTISFS